jgi:hypothetical protein
MDELATAGVTLSASAGEKQTASAKAKYKYLTVAAFLSSVNNAMYWKLLEDLENDLTKGS